MSVVRFFTHRNYKKIWRHLQRIIKNSCKNTSEYLGISPFALAGAQITWRVEEREGVVEARSIHFSSLDFSRAAPQIATRRLGVPLPITCFRLTAHLLPRRLSPPVFHFCQIVPDCLFIFTALFLKYTRKLWIKETSTLRTVNR